MVKYIIKRDNSTVIYDEEKIKKVIEKAFINNGIENKDIINSIYKEVCDILFCKDEESISVEEVQDIIQKALWNNGYSKIAISFIEYRFSHKKERERLQGIYDSISKICKDTDRENANVGHNPSAKLLQMAETISKSFYENNILNKEIKNFIDSNEIYPHDSSWSAIGTTTCLFIPLRKFLENGFNAGHGYINKPKRIKTAAQLSCIILQSNQNDQHR